MNKFKFFSIAVVLLMAVDFGFGQKKNKTFTLNWDEGFFEYAFKTHHCYNLEVNGVDICKGNQQFHIRSNFPDFDTVWYGTTKSKFLILCRFKPEEKYVVVSSCCDMFDFHEDRKWTRFQKAIKGKNDEYIDSVRMLLFESANVSFLLESHSSSDTIFGSYGDVGVIPVEGYLLSNHKLINAGIAKTGYYSSSINTVCISKLVKLNGSIIKENYIEDIMTCEYEDLFFVRFRFFNREKILVTFDAATKKTAIQIAK